MPLGSQLIAKSSPGGKLRTLTEQNAENPAIPGKGDVGTISRTQVEEPLNRPVPPGSDKIISVQPTVEGTTVSQGDIVPAGGVGLNPTTNAPLRSGAGDQALFQGNGGGDNASRPAAAPSQPAGRVNPGGATATPTAAKAPARAAAAYVPAPQVLGLSDSQPSQSASQNQQVQGGTTTYQRDPFLAAVTTLGNKAYADTKNAVNKVVSYTPTAGQYVSGAAGKVASAVGNVVNSPALRSLGSQLQSFGGQPNTTVGSISKAVSNVANNVGKTVGSTVNNLRSAASSTVNNLLRSLFGGKK